MQNSFQKPISNASAHSLSETTPILGSHPDAGSQTIKNFRCYTKQQPAIAAADSASDSFVVSHEFSASGARRYMVTTTAAYWVRYQALPASDRSDYEVIRADKPVKLHFDLDLYKSEHGWVSQSVWQKLVCSLKTEVIRILRDVYCVTFAMSDILDIESSSSTKWSRHLVFCGPVVYSKRYGRIRPTRAIFRNNIECGYIVKRIVQRITDQDSGRWNRTLISMVDTSIYTKNRNMRLVLSAKRASICRGVGNYSHAIGLHLSDAKGHNDFSSTLIGMGYVTEDTVTVAPGIVANPQTRIAIADNVHTAVRVQPSIPPHHRQAMSYYRLCAWETLQSVRDDIRALISTWGRSRAPWQRDTQSGCLIGNEPTDIDRTSVLYDATGAAYATEYSVLPDGKIRVLVANNRFCMNRRRVHKRNRIYFVIDVSLRIATQMCFDGDCKGFRSPPIKL